LISIPVDRTRIRRSRDKTAEMSSSLTILRRRPNQPPRTSKKPGAPGRAPGRKDSTVPKSPAGVSTTNPCVRRSLAGRSDLASIRSSEFVARHSDRHARSLLKMKAWVNSLPQLGRPVIWVASERLRPNSVVSWGPAQPGRPSLAPTVPVRQPMSRRRGILATVCLTAIGRAASVGSSDEKGARG
jgi:hypothetical protein